MKTGSEYRYHDLTSKYPDSGPLNILHKLFWFELCSVHLQNLGYSGRPDPDSKILDPRKPDPNIDIKVWIFGYDSVKYIKI